MNTHTILDVDNNSVTEMYMNRLKEKVLSLVHKLLFKSDKVERNVLFYLLHDDPSIIIKEADKGSALVI